MGGAPRIEEEQVRYFRARRAHLAGPGAADVASAARTILGAQAQQERPALHALSLRTGSRPTARQVRAQLVETASRRLVRTWGQRDTLHVYAPEDWRPVIAARSQWPQSGRHGAMPSEADVARVGRLFAAAEVPLLRSDLFETISPAFVDEVAQHPGAGNSPLRMAATRLIWRLAMDGEICFADRHGSELSYAHRQLWFPDLDWPRELDPVVAARRLARRYLAVNGPATAADIAHFFGARVSAVRTWIAPLLEEIVEVSCGGRQGLLALENDLDAMCQPAPRGLAEWPVRLLPQWDTHLMRHKDKSWLMQAADELSLVWRKAAVVAPAVLARGRIVATWAQRSSSRRLGVTVTPLSGWRKSYRRQVEQEAAALAVHHELPEVIVEVEATS